MVWQDFLFACAAYAEEEPLRGEVVAEAREDVTRLTPHPSLVLWNGNNENIWGYEDWGWKETLGGRTWGMGYYIELLPAIVAELDPTRPYSRRAARARSTTGASPQRPRPRHHAHLGRLEPAVDYTDYRDYVPRFVAEFGFQGPPAWSTLTRAVHDEPLRPDSPGMLLHQKAEDGNAKLDPRPRAAPAGPGGHRRLALGDVSSTRPGPSPSASSTSAPGHRAAPARSSGSSTTAGRSPPGPPSTATDGASRCGTRSGTPTPTGC